MNKIDTRTEQDVWSRLSSRAREALLKRLGIYGHKLASGTRWLRVIHVDQYSRLPIPLRTMLSEAFVNGRFSKTARDRQWANVKANCDDADRAEREYEDGPDI